MCERLKNVRLSLRFTAVIILLLKSYSYTSTEAIVPGGDWRDTDGNLVAATEGGFLQVGDTFF